MQSAQNNIGNRRINFMLFLDSNISLITFSCVSRTHRSNYISYMLFLLFFNEYFLYDQNTYV